MKLHPAYSRDTGRTIVGMHFIKRMYESTKRERNKKQTTSIPDKFGDALPGMWNRAVTDCRKRRPSLPSTECCLWRFALFFSFAQIVSKSQAVPHNTQDDFIRARLLVCHCSANHVSIHCVLGRVQGRLVRAKRTRVMHIKATAILFPLFFFFFLLCPFQSFILLMGAASWRDHFVVLVYFALFCWFIGNDLCLWCENYETQFTGKLVWFISKLCSYFSLPVF